MVLVLLSCGRDQATGPVRAPAGVARGLSFNAVFPELVNSKAFASFIDFDRVRVLLHHADGTVALDTLVNFPAGVDAVTLSFDVTLAEGTPAAGELLSLNLAYVNAQGDTVFRGGPVDLRAAVAIEGAPPPPPVTIPVIYTGPGASAQTIRISPRTLTVNANASFAFTGTATNAAGAAVPDAPIIWVTPDPTLATIPVPTAGAGTANAARGTARIIAQLLNGASDTVTLNVNPVPTAVAVATGDNQVGVIGKPSLQPLAQPIAVRVTAADGLGVLGVSVTFAAANGGSVSPATVVTDAAGLAQTTWSLGTAATAQTATATVAGGLAGSPATFNATGAVKPATKLVVTSGPVAGVDIPSGSPTPLVIAAQDVDGDPALGFTGDVTVALSANPAEGTLAGTLTVSAVGGTAAFPAISIAKPGAGYVIQATSGTLTSVSTNPFNIVTGPAANLVLVSGGAQTAEAGASLSPTKVLVTDVNGNPKAGATVTFAPGATFGVAAPASVVTAADGTASTTWTLGPAVGAQALVASTGGVAPLTVTATAVAVVRQWVITQQPSASVVAGSPIAPAITAELRDAFDKVVSSFGGPVSLVIGANPGSATLSGTTTLNAVAGVATFSGLSINNAANGYTLVVTSSGASDATSNLFNITPSAPASLAIVSGNAQTAAAGSLLPEPLIVKLSDSFGNAIPATSVTFTVVSGGGSVTPVTGSTDASGQLSTVWTLGSASAAQTVSITSAGVATLTATATATSAARVLVVTQQPATSQTAGVALSPVVTVEMRDGFDALVPSFTGPVTIAISSNCCEATLSGPATVNAVAGVASFPGISLDKRGGGYTLDASATGATSATTSSFTVEPAVAASLAVVSGDGQTGAAGSALPQQVVAFVTDAFGNGVSGATVTFTVATGGGSATPVSGSTDATGRIGSTWTLGAAATSQTLTVGSTGLTSVTATATASGAALAWAVKTPPAAIQSAGTITPAMTVELKDEAGAVSTTYNGSVTASIASGPTGATLGGTTTITAASGTATFSDLTLAKPGTYTLSFSSSGAGTATTAAFTVTVAAAVALSVESGGSQTGTFGAMLAAPVVVKVSDVYGNGVSGQSVIFAVASGGGSVGTPNATTDASGLASTTWTLGPSGAQTISGTSSGLSGSPLTISAITAGGSVARTVVSPRNDTLTSLGATRALSALARDVDDNVVAGSFSWISRDPSIATVSSGGVLTAVANGSTYVVAMEIGGTRDSALAVVEQRIASVNITPASRSLYVTGTFAYSAQAVDGRGNSMASQPTFTWSSTSPTVASVDAGTGAVTALSIGSTQIRATSGATIGVSVLSVLTPIKRILISYDSAGAAAPDTFTMTALGLRRAYRAVARDTLDNVMTGVTFTWNSTNGSVAAIDAPAATTAGAISAANGVTSIQASAQGVTGSATLYVAQVLASIELTPAAASVSVGGSTSLLARGKDSQGRYISGGSFTYTSSGPAFASVNSTTGVVTGVANGGADITATSGSITSNVSTITVSNEGVPSVITFGRDTIGVGRGTSVSVPILLSKPSGAALIIQLAAVDTNAYWATPTVTIPAGATSVNATLNGRNAGTTRVSALDGSDAGYTGDTAVVAVQANMRLTTTYYSLNETDQVATQVVLSDPSPAGGTYVTFSYGTADIASVSPDPAFIPAGQLAADIVIRGIGAGSTTLTPLATGVSGTGATVAVAAAKLNIPYTSVRVGAGQYEQYVYVSLPNVVSVPLHVTLTNSDSAVAVTLPSLTIPSGSSYAYFEVDGRAPGSEQVTASATGWTSASLAVTVTTPKLSLCCSYSLNSSSPAQNLTVYSADSTGTIHPRQSSLVVRITSSDTTVIKVLDSLTTIPAGQYYSNSGRVIPNGLGGTAWIYVSAGGHSPDSVKFTVVGPSLTFGYNTRTLGLGQIEPNGYVYIPNAISKPLVVTLTNSDSTIAATNATITVPAGSSYAYFDLRGRGTGTNTIIASAPGYIPDTAETVVTTPRVRLAGGSSLNSYAIYTTNVYAEDSLGSVHNRLADLTVSLRSSDTTVLKVDTLVVIPAGSYYVPAGVRLTAVNPGTAMIYVTAPGHMPDSVTWTVTPARVQLSWGQYVIGARQHQNNGFYAYIPNARDVSVAVTLTQTNAAAVTLSSTTVTIPANSSYQYFDLAGVLPGIDSVIATASGYVPDTAVVRVSTPYFRIASAPSSGTTSSPNATVQLYLADSTLNVHYTNDTVVVHAVSSDTTVIKPTEAYFRIVKDSYIGSSGFQYVGPGTATITYSDSGGSSFPYTAVTTNTVTVTGPSLAIAGAATGMLGTGQHTGVGSYYIYLSNAIGTPLKVALLSTDPRVATVDDTVTVPAGSYYAYFTITAQDTIGTVQIQATAVGYKPASVNMQVTKPKFIMNASTSLYTSSPTGYIYVYAADANGSSHQVNSDVVVSLLSSAPGVASIDSTTVTLVKDNYYSNIARWSPGAVGTAQLSASDERAIRYPYTTATVDVNVTTPPAYLSIGTTTLGLGQYVDAYTSIPYAPRSDLTVPLTHAATPTTSTPSSVTIPSSTNYVYFRVQTSGTGVDTITASPPGHTPAIGVVSVAPGVIGPLSGWPTSLAVGDSVLVTLYTRGPDGGSTHPVKDATTFTLGSNANISFVLGGATITSAVVPADSYYVQFYVKGVAAGTANATITNSNYITYTNIVTVNP